MTTAKRVRELLEYLPETGEFFWRISPSNIIKAGAKAGNLSAKGYILIGVDRKVLKAHRIAWLYVYGRAPVCQIDHINGIKSDNRISNLREVTAEGNCQNLRKAYSNNRSSGVLGVYWHEQAAKWQAKIMHRGKAKSLGLFDSVEAASTAYLCKKRELHAFCTI